MWTECYYRRQKKKTFTKVLGADKDIVHRDQTVENKKKDVRFDSKRGFYQSEEKRNCHIYVTSLMVVIFMFLLKQSTLSAVIFLFVPVVLSSVYHIRMFAWYQIMH